MKKILISMLAALSLGLTAGGAYATYQADISYTATDNGGGNYTFNFNVANTSTGADTGGLDFFQIFFDADAIASRYSGLTWGASNGWSVFAEDSTSALSGVSNVTADDSVLVAGSGGIAQGASLGGFAVTFNYGGVTPPALLDIDDHFFSYHAEFGTNLIGNGTDMGGYWIMGDANGTTTFVAPLPPPPPPGPAVIPEPGTMLLFGIGLAGLVGHGLARKKQ
ncbi:MAG: PEP-CTERM sorting domain-containing protein [Nitrospirae bacterium]|nr:PEP-CTERM sorting domain-containing protein [Nitrospirota bacterium]